MKRKIRAALIAAATGAICLFAAVPAMASEWVLDSVGWWLQRDDGSYPANAWELVDNQWYYFDQRGYMLANTWVGNYYLGSDGAMLTNTITPDGYRVGADGAWIPDLPTAAYYYNYVLNPDVYLEHGNGLINASVSDIVDHGTYYEIRNQSLRAGTQYDYPPNNGIEYYRLPSGKYISETGNDFYIDSYEVYRGSIYADKNVQVVSLDYRSIRYMTLEEYLTSDLYESYIGLYGTITYDNKGYVIEISVGAL